MRDAALLAVWIIGLFTLIGGVMAVVVRFVNKDTSAYDKQLTWGHFPQAQDRSPEGTSETVQEDRRG